MWPRLMPSSGVPHSRASSAARRIVPSPPMTTTTSQSAAGFASAATTSTSGALMPSSVASSASTRVASPCLVSPRQKLTGHLARVRAPDVGDHQDPTLVGGGAAGHGPSLSSGAPSSAVRRTSSAISASPTVAGPRRNHTKNSTFPAGPGSGLVVTAARTPATLGREPRDARRPPPRAAPDSRTTPPRPTRPLPTSNCGFTISTRSPSSSVTPRRASSTRPQRDERQVADHEVDPATEELRGQVADVGAVVHLDPVVALQGPGELAVAHVDGHHRCGAGSQQDVGEAAGRGARVEAAAAAHDQPRRLERRQRAGQLVPAARDVVGS